MVIYRDGQAIELTELELDQAYREAKLQLFADEVAWQLREFHDIDPETEHVDCKQIASDVLDLLCEDDAYWECEQEAYRVAIREYLNERN